ncbi:MAG: hypothetical protein Q9174_001889, partial [Haloplaca sp. 1 TL-2023]
MSGRERQSTYQSIRMAPTSGPAINNLSSREICGALKTSLQAILDTPCNFFTEELITAYPSALVILNTRPFDSWYRSMNETIWKVGSWPSWRFLQYMGHHLTRDFYQLLRLEWEVFCGHDYSAETCRQAVEERHAHIRAVVPKE